LSLITVIEKFCWVLTEIVVLLACIQIGFWINASGQDIIILIIFMEIIWGFIGGFIFYSDKW